VRGTDGVFRFPLRVLLSGARPGTPSNLRLPLCRARLWTVTVPAPRASALFSFFSRGRADLSGLLSDSPKQVLFYCFSSRAGVADLGFHSTQPLFLQPPSPFGCPCWIGFHASSKAFSFSSKIRYHRSTPLDGLRSLSGLVF
jgi:hypothetical protein